jgi:glycosyltransferase involved in cell wall biosynthesis
VTPFLSVLIATHNRREMLARCLAALAAQSEDPAAFEVIVADDGSTDGTAAALAELSTPFELRTIEHAKAGKPVVLNAAIEAARGEVCLFIDDDVIASPQLVAEHLAAHRREPRTLGIGVLVQREPEGNDWYVRAFTRAWNEHFDELRRRPARWTDCYGANFSAPRSTLEEIGGFASDVPTVEDFDIAYRLDGAGLAARYLPNATAVHDDEKTRGRMLADTKREGAAYAEFAARHPGTAKELLDWRAGAGPAELRLRRGLIALRVPPGPVVALGALVPGEGRKMVWLHFVRRLALWRAVRGAVSRERWREVTRRGAPR